jgi:hypothetical protein
MGMEDERRDPVRAAQYRACTVARRRPSMLEGTCDARFNQADRDAFFALGDVAPSWTIEEGARMAAVRAHHIFR